MIDLKRKIKGPDRVVLHLDATEIYPDNPGNGTPIMVEYMGAFATYNCAMGEGEIEGIELPREVMQWLDNHVNILDDWLDYHYERLKQTA